MHKITFNRPYLTGNESTYMLDAVQSRWISGNGKYTKLCQRYFEEKYAFKKCLLTSSCTDALEMAAILIDVQPGDEIIMPSYTFVSTANAFVLRGAKIIFADSNPNHPNMDTSSLESLITAKTKAIVPVHYAGMACDMEKIMALAATYNLYVVEDAAQAIDSYYTFQDGSKKALGSIGHLAAFSFHETKNIISGEGGMLAVNDERFVKRAEIIWEKGTNRSAFYRGEVNKYGWVDVGSSFLPSDMIAAFLFAQLENLDRIQNKRKAIWNQYYNALEPLAQKRKLKLPEIPLGAENNAHMFYLITNTEDERSSLIQFLGEKGIHAVFHYLSLHKSEFYAEKHDQRELAHCDMFSGHLVRLPFYYELTADELNYITESISTFYNG